MRTALLPLAIATSAALGFLSASHGEDDLRHEEDKDGLPSVADFILKEAGLGGEFRPTADRLAAFLDLNLYRSLAPRQRLLLVRYARNRFESPSPITRCWSPETPLDLLLTYHSIEEAARSGQPAPRREGEDPTLGSPLAPLKANQFFRRWDRTATDGSGGNVQGRPITLTWSIVPDGTPIPSDPDIGDSSDPSTLRARLSQIYGGDTGPPQNQPWFPIFQAAFDNVSAHTGINYLYQPDDDGQQLGVASPGLPGMRSDVRIGGHRIDGDNLTLSYNYFPDNGDMVLDTNDTWFNNTANNSIRLRNILEHEHGHGLGMEHVCPIDQTKLMEPFINSIFRGLQFDEIYTLQRWYGDAYEHHSPARDNDSFLNAAPLPVSPGTPFGVEWLSIDDDSDLDYFSLAVPADSSLTVRVLPSTRAYLEGAQNANGTCSSGAVFDPGANHNLRLELIGPDQAEILASATSNPAGQPEEILDFPTPRNGTHYLRVTGGSADLAQLYRLEVEVTPPSVSFALDSLSIIAESFSPPNGVIEPGETVAVDLALTNAGNLDATSVQATLSGPVGFTGFEVTPDFGLLVPAQVTTRTVVFGLQGDCGSTLSLDLTITAEGGLQRVIPLEFPLGIVTTLLSQSFDSNGASLPPGWSSSFTGGGRGWLVNNTRSASPPSSLYGEDVAAVGTSSLTSPTLTLGANGGTLSFQHLYDTEFSGNTGFDGGVLEVSLNGGPWIDLLAAGATFTQGGYVRTMSTQFQNPLSGRQAWSGDSGGWITTVADLPPGLGDQPLRFRWRIGHDTSVGSPSGFEGWFLDDVVLVSKSCDHTAPRVTLTVEDDTASEFSPLDTAQFTLTTPLPRLTSLNIPLLNVGSATIGLDASGLDAVVVIPPGQSAVQVIVQALPDLEVEGLESLLLSIDPAAGLVADGLPSATITISDPPYGLWAANELGLGTRNLPSDDLDGDGALNIEEYAWQTLGSSPASRPDLTPRLEPPFLRLDAPLSALPADLQISAESSLDLENWSPVGVEVLGDGFGVPAVDPQRFLRLLYQLLPTAP